MPSILIAEPDPSRLAELTDLDELDRFEHLELTSLLTLDFEVLTSEANFSWSDGEPIYHDPVDGQTIFKVSSEGLEFVAQLASSAESRHQEDLALVAKFVATHGTSHIYELTTY